MSVAGKTLYRRLGVIPGQIAAAYRIHKSSRKVASIIGCSTKTVLRIVRQFGIKAMPPGGFSQRGKLKKLPHWGAVARWLRENPGVRLPAGVEDIAKLVGCSADAVKCYLYRRRKTGEAIPDLRTLRYKRRKTK